MPWIFLFSSEIHICVDKSMDFLINPWVDHRFHGFHSKSTDLSEILRFIVVNIWWGPWKSTDFNQYSFNSYSWWSSFAFRSWFNFSSCLKWFGRLGAWLRHHWCFPLHLSWDMVRWLRHQSCFPLLLLFGLWLSWPCPEMYWLNWHYPGVGIRFVEEELGVVWNPQIYHQIIIVFCHFIYQNWWLCGTILWAMHWSSFS